MLKLNYKIQTIVCFILFFASISSAHLIFAISKNEEFIEKLNQEKLTQEDFTDLLQLINDNVDPNTKNKNGQTILHSAINLIDDEENSSKIVESLLKQNKIKVAVQDNSGNTPLHLAVKKDYSVITQKLLNKDDTILNNKNKNGSTPLSLAIRMFDVHSDNKDIINLLLNQKNIDVNTINKTGFMPLHFLLEKTPYPKSNLEDIFIQLVNKGAKINLPVPSGDRKGWTALHVAVRADNERLVQLLLDKNAESNPIISDGRYKGFTPMHFAQDNKNIIKKLLKHGAKINQQNDVKQTALHIAADLNKTDAVKTLLEHGADPSIKDINNQTPIELTKEETIKKILKESIKNQEKVILDLAQALHSLEQHG